MNDSLKNNIIEKIILQLKDKKVVYVLEENDSTCTYRKQKVNGYILALVCRRRKCKKRLRIHPINKLRDLSFIYAYR